MWKAGQSLFAEAELTQRARQYVRAGEYRYFSPVFAFNTATGHVQRILMGALTNHPAISGMQPLALAGAHPDQLIFGLLAQGREENCYDGTPFFGTEHKVINAKGKDVKVANVDDDAGATTPSWYLLDTRRSLKPLILQTRKEPNFVSKATETDDNVFWNAEYVYGVDCRRAAGFAFWQLAYASNKALTAENLQAAITAMSTQTGDHGRPLGISPNLLVVPRALRFDAKRLLEAELLVGPNGTTTESNVLRGAAELLVADWL